MTMDAIIPAVTRELNTLFEEFLARRHPDRVFSKVGFTNEIEVDAGKDVQYDSMVDSLQPQWVEPHERENKNGEVRLVKGYWKQPKELTAMDVAVAEANQENGGGVGLDIEAELEAFVDALSSGTITLGQMNS